MSPPDRPQDGGLELIVPPAWSRFLRSGEYAGARASIRAGESEVPVELLARLEFVDDRRLAIELALAQHAATGSEPSLVQRLTARERAVITLIATGLETQEIADTLHVSSSTVRTHVRNAMAKLGAHTRAQLVALAMAVPEHHPDDHPDGRGPEDPAPRDLDRGASRIDR
jgi:DNA-binding CsgD family transcriptional regulator